MKQPREIGRLLVTGATGFVGRHVAAMVQSGALSVRELVSPPAGWDLRNEDEVYSFVEDVKPDSVLHLAAQSFVPRSFEHPRETLEINVIGTLNLLQALKRAGCSARIVYVSSGDVYGQVPESLLPVDEALYPEPRNPYAVSKVAAEQLCLQWHRSEGTDVVIARPFNHVGPGQDDRFVLSSVARQLAKIADKRQDPVIEVGDIDTTRDFTDVRDVVHAYEALLRYGEPGRTYVIGSGRECRIRDLLQYLCKLAEISPEFRQDPGRMRRADQRRMAANSARLRQDTGWAPTIHIETTLEDILKDARNRT